jgi:hypothetical protein
MRLAHHESKLQPPWLSNRFDVAKCEKMERDARELYLEKDVFKYPGYINALCKDLGLATREEIVKACVIEPRVLHRIPLPKAEFLRRCKYNLDV